MNLCLINYCKMFLGCNNVDTLDEDCILILKSKTSLSRFSKTTKMTHFSEGVILILFKIIHPVM